MVPGRHGPDLCPDAGYDQSSVHTHGGLFMRASADGACIGPFCHQRGRRAQHDRKRRKISGSRRRSRHHSLRQDRNTDQGRSVGGQSHIVFRQHERERTAQDSSLHGGTLSAFHGKSRGRSRQRAKSRPRGNAFQSGIHRRSRHSYDDRKQADRHRQLSLCHGRRGLHHPRRQETHP